MHLPARAIAPYVLLLLPATLAACVDAHEPAPDDPLSWREGSGSGSDGGSGGSSGGPGGVLPPPYAVPGEWTFDEPVCGVEPDPAGGGLAQQLGIDPPIPPQAYASKTCTVPQMENDECRLVGDAGELQDAVLSDPGNNMDIILEDGIYLASDLDPGTSHLTLARAHRLWAQNTGGAVLTFGIVAGGNPCNPALAPKLDGAEFHGLVFDITDAQYAVPVDSTAEPPRAALMAWGHSRGMKVQDCWFRGWDEVDRAISVHRPDGLVVERVEVLSFKRFGVFVELGWPTPSAACPADPAPVVVGDPARLSDLSVHGIGDPVWASQDPEDCGNGTPGVYCPGTQEHGIWIGETTLVDRARVRDVAWGGILVGDNTKLINRVSLRDIDVDDVGSNEDGWGAGVAFEAGNDGTTLEQFCVGPNVRRGVHAEWDHHGASPENVNVTIADGWSRAEFIGISLDSGTRDISIENVRIDNACLASTFMRANNDILPYDNCCTTTTWTGLDDLAATNTCEVLFDHHPSVTAALQAPSCASLFQAVDCANFVDSDTMCLDNGGMDACP